MKIITVIIGFAICWLLYAIGTALDAMAKDINKKLDDIVTSIHEKMKI